MHAGEIGAIGEREAVDRVGVVQAVGFACAHVGQVSPQKRGEFGAPGLGPHRAVNYGEPVGARPHLARQLRERVVAAEAAQLIVESIEERAPFTIGETHEILRARAGGRVGQQVARERQADRRRNIGRYPASYG